MKWKTSTIILILIISIGVIAFTLYEKKNAIQTLEDTLEQRVEEKVKLEREKLSKEYESRFQNFENKNESLKKEIAEITEQVRFIRYGGENEFYINQIISNSKKTIEKLKIRKGEVYKHKKSGIVIFIKRDNYEDQVSLNLTLPNKKSEEWDWQTGKFYYYWNAQKNELSQILPTFIGDKSIEIEWTYYKANEDFNKNFN